MTDPPLDRTQVAAELRRLRQAAGLTLVQAAGAAGMSQSTLTRYELARFDPPESAVRALLSQYRPSRAERARLLAATRERQPRYKRVVMHRGAAANQAAIGDLERQAVYQTTFAPTVVPGLLQSENYMRAFAGAALEPDALEEWVANRLTRQRILDSPGHEFEQIVTAGALLWGVGGADVMREQIDRLESVARSGDVRFGIVPAGAPTVVLPLHAFDLYEFDDGSRQVHFGTHGGTVTISDERGVEEYRKLLGSLRDLAVFDVESVARELRGLRGWYGTDRG